MDKITEIKILEHCISRMPDSLNKKIAEHSLRIMQEKYMGKVYWGTPLEHISWELRMDMICCNHRAYTRAMELYRAFMRVNPNFWQE